MITDNERREVAARLREVKKTGFDFTWCKICMVVCGPECPVGCDEDEMAVDAAKRLADLIEHEPERTCHMEPDEIASHAMCGPAVRCDACGAAVPAVGTLRYCPNCGAKVVEVVDE